ncbi:MAG: ABC transporter permease [Deltaproteobacteria bacterium]
MSLFRLTVRNASRTPVRGAMTVVAVAITLVAYVLLRTLSAAWTDRIEQTPNDRVVTRHRIGWAGSLPAHYTDVVRSMPGVKRATSATWVGLALPTDVGVVFESVAVDAREFVDMHYELSAPDEQKQAFVDNRRGAIVSAEFAGERGWKVGDQLHLKGRNIPGGYDFTLEAIVKSTRVGFGQHVVWFHWEYFNETQPQGKRDRIEQMVAQVVNPTDGARLAKTIDIHFDTEIDQTFSQDDKALNTAIVGRFGAILGAMNLVSLLVLGVVVLILGNTVAMSTRERTREYGVLRAMGFMPWHLAAFVLGEAATLGLVSGGLGLTLAYPLVQGTLSRYLAQQMGVAPLRVKADDAGAALLLGLVLGLVAAGIPAFKAARQELTESLSRVA